MKFTPKRSAAKLTSDKMGHLKKDDNKMGRPKVVTSKICASNKCCFK